MLAFAARQTGPDVWRAHAGLPRGLGGAGSPSMAAENPLAWIARNASRPGYAAVPDGWVANASAPWSRIHLAQSAETVLPLLLAAFAAATGITAEPAYAAVHRWRYAQTETPLGVRCLWDASSGLVVCGDWCLGARVEAAFISGRAAAACLA
jgi:renalase